MLFKPMKKIHISVKKKKKKMNLKAFPSLTDPIRSVEPKGDFAAGVNFLRNKRRKSVARGNEKQTKKKWRNLS